MNLFGINITFGDPQQDARRAAEELLNRMVGLKELNRNRISNGSYIPWWEEHIDKYADWIIDHTKDDLTRKCLIQMFCEYIRTRKMDIELKSDTLKHVSETIRQNTR